VNILDVLRYDRDSRLDSEKPKINLKEDKQTPTPQLKPNSNPTSNKPSPYSSSNPSPTNSMYTSKPVQNKPTSSNSSQNSKVSQLVQAQNEKIDNITESVNRSRSNSTEKQTEFLNEDNLIQNKNLLSLKDPSKVLVRSHSKTKSLKEKESGKSKPEESQLRPPARKDSLSMEEAPVIPENYEFVIKKQMLAKASSNGLEILCSASVKLFEFSKETPVWTDTRISGLLILLKDRFTKDIFFQISDVENLDSLFSFHVPDENFEYEEASTYFHKFNVSDGYKAFAFFNEEEAQIFFEMINEAFQEKFSL